VSGYYNEYSDDLDGNGRQGEGGALRKMLEEALGEIRELKTELGKVQTESKAKSVSKLLESKGLNPAVAQIIPEGANVDEWLEQHGSLFKTTDARLDEDESGELPPAQDEPDPDLLAEQEAWEASHGVSSGTPSNTSSLDPMKQLEMADTPEKLMALIDQATRALPAD
jgi:hypothetical protein